MRYLVFTALLLFPAFSYAHPHNFSDLVDIFLDIINLLVPLVFGLTLVVFLWGISRAWIWGGGDPVKVEEGKRIALIGIIALTVMAGVWGILSILRASLF